MSDDHNRVAEQVSLSTNDETPSKVLLEEQLEGVLVEEAAEGSILIAADESTVINCSADENDNEEEDVVTLQDVVNDDDDLEATSRAVLGTADDSTCSFPKGYVKRQPLYACLTCCGKDGARRAGVCLGCCITCHDGHELVELYTKRNFRCDCGNSKFLGFVCNLMDCKDDVNELNVYNHNFDGVYCVCSRPYPDPDESVDDEMIQCIFCEDWYHSRHLEFATDSTTHSDGAELICQRCMDKAPFLKVYAITSAGSSSIEASSTIDVTDADKSACKLAKFRCTTSEQLSTKAQYFAEGWRTTLCRCGDCMNRYSSLKCEFLLDPEDSASFYEAQTKDSGLTVEEKCAQALEQVDRVKQIEILHEYNNMRDGLTEYLKKFAENGKVVREEDIREFFEGLKSQKRQKVSVPDFCI